SNAKEVNRNIRNVVQANGASLVRGTRHLGRVFEHAAHELSNETTAFGTRNDARSSAQALCSASTGIRYRALDAEIVLGRTEGERGRGEASRITCALRSCSLPSTEPGTASPKAPDNEERSARYAERLCAELFVPDGPLIPSLILKTKTHDADDDDDARVLI